MTIRKFKILLALALSLIGAVIIYSSNRLAIRAASATTDQTAPQDRPEANRNPGDAHEMAAKFYLQKRLPEGEREIPVERYLEAREQARRMSRYSTAQSRFLSQAEAEADSAAAWTELGPGNIGGRTRALIIHPTNHDTMYAAAAAGGVWKTTDGGASWRPLADQIANLAVNALAMDRTDPNMLYAGTGESFFNFDAIRGASIFKTVDGGATWARLAATATSDFHYVNDIVVSPTDGRRIYAATRAGVWRSVDGGASWTRTLDPAVTGGCLDLVIRSDQTTDYLFASCGTAFSQAKVYRNTDASGAGAWTEVLSDPGMGRTSLALAPSNQNIIYAASANPATSNQPGLHAIFRSTASGDPNTWTAQVRKTDATKLNTILFSWTRDAFFSNCGLGPDRFFNTGWYANSMAVGPTDANRVWVGGVELFRSDDGGANWGLASYSWIDASAQQYAHTHHHAIVFHPQYNGAGNKTMFVAGDGGIYRTNDALAATATGTTAIAVAPDDSNLVLAGTNAGSIIRNANALSGGSQWTSVAPRAGYVSWLAFDPVDHNVVYATYSTFGGGHVWRSADSGATWSGIDGAGAGALPDVPVHSIVVDPQNRSRLFIGTDVGIFVTTDGGASWAVESGTPNAVTEALTLNAGSNATQLFAFTYGRGAWRTSLGANDCRIGADGIITTVIGSAPVVFGDEGLPASSVRLAAPTGVAIDRAGNLYVAESARNRVLIISDNRSLSSVQAASFTGPSLAGESIVAAFDANLATTTQAATELPLPTTLAGTTVRVRDSLGQEMFAPLFFVSPNQINYQMPPGLANGPATAIVTNQPGATSSGDVMIETTAPGLFSANANGQGVAAALALRIKPDGAQVYEPVAVFDQTSNRFVVRPLDFGATGDQLFLILFGTGLRRATLSAVNAQIGGEPVDTLFVGAQGGFAGLDQINLSLPRTLAGRGEVDVALSVDGKATNTLRIALAGAPCSFQVSAPDQTVPAAGGVIAVNVASTNSCFWSARSDTNWITTNFNGVASGAGVVNFSLSPNASPLPRAGEIRVAGQTVILTQAGTEASPPPAVTVTRPSDTGSFTTPEPVVSFGGAANAGAGVAFLTWSNDRGGGGFAGGTINWSVEDVRLQLGVNNLTVTAYDSLGRTGSARFAVNFKPEWEINTVAGGGQNDPAQGGRATDAKLAQVTDVVVDAAGNLYLSSGPRVFKVTPSGVISVFAGNGQSGLGADNVPAANSPLGSAGGLALDRAGNLYIADPSLNVVRKVDARTNLITTVAGRNAPDNYGFSGDGGPATQARLHYPRDVALDSAGNLFIADLSNHRIRKVDAAMGIITTVAGNGTYGGSFTEGGDALATAIGFLGAVAIGPDNNLYLTSNSQIRKIDLATRRISAFIQNSTTTHNGGTVSSLSYHPVNLAFDASGNLFFADSTYPNNYFPPRVWRVAAQTGSIARLAGDRTTGPLGDGGPAVLARLEAAVDVAPDATGHIYIADGTRVRKLTPVPALGAASSKFTR